ncbi:helix-turn-helix transcriptional regulator [Amycolatopsis jiangsuensis]|uniref:DNA-binding CsgD family transcriptional regulator n=1 Tax=Amycolatopsis jiangsuensis TaxID=1181879 RepID=A0A840IW17_9PSEU|nr:helix-turn-helix transcriptional regulator [Amycolatopsis jiangsuensis]MBB4685709.1 DNA-binding CsgD family transcriptional regulator [Amycolatopsis jiangsuensis]
MNALLAKTDTVHPAARRLFAGHNASATPVRLVVVAPGGYGKTALLDALDRGYRAAGVDATLIDDADQLDDENLAKLTMLAASTDGPLVVAHRPNPRADALRGLGETFLLPALEVDEVAELARHLTGHTVNPTEAAALHTRTGGVPRLVERVVTNRWDDFRTDLAALDDDVLRYLIASEAGASRNLDLLCALLKRTPHALSVVVDGARATGLLDPEDALLPVAAQVVRTYAPPARRLAVVQQLVETQLRRGLPILDLACALLDAGSSGASAATAFATAAHEALPNDLKLAARLFEAATDAGAHDAATTTGWARAAALSGDLDTALRLGDGMLSDENPESRAAGAEIAATVLAHRGELARSAELYRWAAATDNTQRSITAPTYAPRQPQPHPSAPHAPTETHTPPQPCATSPAHAAAPSSAAPTPATYSTSPAQAPGPYPPPPARASASYPTPPTHASAPDATVQADTPVPYSTPPDHAPSVPHSAASAHAASADPTSPAGFDPSQVPVASSIGETPIQPDTSLSAAPDHHTVGLVAGHDDLASGGPHYLDQGVLGDGSRSPRAFPGSHAVGESYRWAGPGAVDAFAAITLVGTGQVAGGRALAEAPVPGVAPTLFTGAVTRTANGIVESVTGHGTEALPELVGAAAMLEPAFAGAPLPDSPAALAALAGLHSGELALAESVLQRALANGVGGDLLVPRHRLLLGWVAMTGGHLATAAEHRDAVAGTKLEARDELFFATLELGIARRTSDLVGLQQSWDRAYQASMRQQVDLFTLLPLGELAIAAARTGAHAKLSRRLERAHAMLGQLGYPPLWTVSLCWHELHASITSEDRAAAERQLSALAGFADCGRYPAALARAAKCWLSVVGGAFDPDEISAAAAELHELDLCWDAARLAGQAAIRTSDRKAMVQLLEAARQFQGTTGRLESPAPAAGTVPGLSVLSERELEVARLVVDGLTYKQAGSKLFISGKTVEHHMARIRGKLGASDRRELLATLRELLVKPAQS